MLLTRADGEQLEIVSLAVKAVYRRQGIGKQLISTFLLHSNSNRICLHISFLQLSSPLSLSFSQQLHHHFLHQTSHPTTARLFSSTNQSDSVWNVLSQTTTRTQRNLGPIVWSLANRRIKLRFTELLHIQTSGFEFVINKTPFTEIQTLLNVSITVEVRKNEGNVFAKKNDVNLCITFTYGAIIITHNCILA